MAQFRLEERLPSTIVSRALIRSLEILVAKQGAALVVEADDQFSPDSAVEVAISDTLGVETVGSVEDFLPSKFPDTTESITVHFNRYMRVGRAIEIEIEFNKNPILTNLKVYCEASNARQIAHGISKSINECVDPHRASNEWAHPGYVLAPALFVLSLGSGAAAAFAAGAKMYDVAIACLRICIITILYQTVIPYLKPFTVFDSRTADIRIKWWDWFLKGALGFAVFGTLFALLRDSVFRIFGL